MSELTPLQRDLLEMLLDLLTGSRYTYSELKEWGEGDPELPSLIRLEDPDAGTFELAFRIEVEEGLTARDYGKATVTWRLE